MLVKARILNRQDRLFDHIGYVVERHQFAPFFAEFANQFAFSREHPHRQLGSVVGQIGDVGQLRVGHGQRHTHEQNQAQQASHAQTCGPSDEAGQHYP